MTNENPRVVDNDKDLISVMLDDKTLREYWYTSDDQRRRQMLCAREFVEGWCDARDAYAAFNKRDVRDELLG